MSNGPRGRGGLRKSAGKPLREVGDAGGQRLRGTLHAVAFDPSGERYAVLETGRHLTAIPADASTELELGREYEARSRSGREEGERRRTIAWQFDDLERLRGRGHDAGL